MTTYHLHADAPEADRVKKSAKILYKELCERIGRENLTGVGIGLNSSQEGPAIRVYLLEEKHVKDVPTVFEGHEVLTEVTGPIVAL